MRRKNAGFTLVEVIMAVSIAVMVSIAAASVILVTRTTSESTAKTSAAVTYAGNVLECFKAADNMNGFKSALGFAYGVENLTVDTTGCDTNDGTTLYIYFGEDGNVVTTAGVEDGTSEHPVNTAWDIEKVRSSKCVYFAAINVAKCDGTAFAAATTLYVAVYKTSEFYSGEPNLLNAENDGNAVYFFPSKYRKGVA